MPLLLSMRDELTGEIRDVLIFSPAGAWSPRREVQQHFPERLALLVRWITRPLKFTVETPFTELDAGFEFYAPQTISGTGLIA